MVEKEKNYEFKRSIKRRIRNNGLWWNCIFNFRRSWKENETSWFILKVCKVLNLQENIVEERIGDFFELLSINKKFVLLPKGYWDLATNHLQNIVIEDEDELVGEDLIEDEIDEEIIDEDNEDIFYDNELDDNDDDEDDLKDLVIIDEDETIES